MSDEKTLLNDKFKKDEEKNSDIMDFSAAFNDDYDEPEQNFDEIGEPTVPVSSIFKSLPFLKKKKAEKPVSEEIKEVAEEEIKEKAVEEDEKTIEAPAEIRTEEKAEDEPIKKESVKENKKNKKNKNKKNKQEKKEEVVEAAEDDSPEYLELGNALVFAEENDEPEEIQEAEPERKPKGFSLFSKKEKTPEPEEKEEQPEEKLIPLDEPQEFSGLGGAIIFAEDDDEPEKIQEAEPERKSKGFSLFSKKKKTPEPEEKEEEQPEEILIPLDESQVKVSDEPILLLGNFEEEKSEEPVVIVSQSEKTEDDLIPSENEAEAETVEMLPSFEEQETVTQEIKEETVEEKAQDVIEELPPFEEVALQEDVIEELPPFEETVAPAEVIEEIPPFEAPAEGEKEIVEEAPALKKKKEKKQKPPKEKKEKKAKKAEVTDAQQKKTTQLMTAKDHLTFILIILALILTIVFVVVKFIPFGNNGAQNVNTVTKAGENVSEIQIQREGALGHCIQSNIENVFYMYSQDDSLAYYKCDNGRMIPLSATGSVQATATLGQDKIPVKLDYVEIDGQLFGTGVFRAKDTEGSYLHSMAVFKLVNLPKGYEQDGKALLLATTNEDALSEKCNVWTDSYVVDLETGVTKRFLTSDNNLFSTGYSILTDEGYASTNGKIPFLTTREYDAVTNKKDIYIKDGNKEASFATDVAGNFIYADGDAVCYLKSTDNGFNAIKNTNGKEAVIFSLRNDTSYMYFNEYLLDKYNGVLYNVKTGEQITVSGYGMSNPELMTVSDDGRYLVVVGTVNNVLDYQVHIFDLKKNSCAKYVDDNFSQHKNLNFIDNSTIVYSAVDPNQGCEYVILDISKAF